MKRVLAGFAALVLGVVGAPQARAECISDCTDAYQEAMAACQQKYVEPEQEIQLQDCMDAAQAQLGTCSDDCESVD